MKKFFLIGMGGMVVSAAAFGLSQSKNNILVHPSAVSSNAWQEEAVISEEKPSIKRMETPKVVRAVYLTAPSGGREDKIQAIINMKKDGLNAVVIDIKDSFGVVAYDSQLDTVNRYELERKFIPDLAALVQRFHDEGIYVIARIAVFQDTALAEARPELAVHDRSKLNAAGGAMSKKTLWRDGKNLAWVDPSSREVGEYVVALSNDALSYGFDELNYDYIRFPSDGKISSIVYSVTKPDASYPVQIRGFMQYLREQLHDTVLSVDLFGFTMVKKEDIGIGQIVEDAYAYFDFVAPMVYPSHYPSGFMGYKNPAAWPYEIIADSMQKGQARLDAYQATASTTAKLRPWLQDFDLGADYDAAMIGKQIQATEDMLGEQYAGYMLWNPSSNYTIGGVQ
ncbi:hypothetical protein A2524_00280 [Candidatus Wolfebacteria bacterium RIFOXYD12_FULL_48_21]|uniref:DUF4015 domain-containing protein n=1 Tax=Candidatus Wolfebacteria bacterium RIFOXYD1_FULL_48_65 TaxID=1802561 RepID=A0A1F8E3S0_9BACT|nr:MAG: hypothetical protein A2610_01555 [Candidatus Wolfebacteria bacterium RIFOXYD1_FULL_48_65]OGM94880.1 MAG: hypothetical protein A2524_00280 [Candidatus Wolfebacteria bacterium RIFOXYD12_FULL_48_21]OGM97101.1 MAG: hypothetical protein A2532_02930 [Candidatus Wolfebacteria bacterium RIFOXYD2_FULL_48_11]